MIVANITTYRGLNGGATHYYCEYVEMPEPYEPKNEVTIHGKKDFKKEIRTQKDADELNRKEKKTHYHIGYRTGRFDSIEEIHQELVIQFPDKNIITYYDGVVFKNMIYIVSGKNLGFEYFGETFIDVPTSCYRDLVPDIYTIKCRYCGVRHLLQDVTVEGEWGSRKTIKFKNPRHFAHKCCDDVELIWNVVFDRG